MTNRLLGLDAAVLPSRQFPNDIPIPDTAGEYLALTFLRKGGLAVVSPIQNMREKRYGFSLWKLEERRGEAQPAK